MAAKKLGSQKLTLWANVAIILYVTLLDIKNHLYAHFLVQSTFSLKEDVGSVELGEAYQKIVKGSPLATKKDAIFKAALEDMEKTGVVVCLDKKEGVYVLTQPLMALPQAVPISPLTAHLVAELINGFGARTGYLSNPSQYVTNKFAITDGDIAAIVQICHALSAEVDELIDMLEGGPPTGDEDDDSDEDGGGYDKLTHPFDPESN